MNNSKKQHAIPAIIINNDTCPSLTIQYLFYGKYVIPIRKFKCYQCYLFRADQKKLKELVKSTMYQKEFKEQYYYVKSVIQINSIIVNICKKYTIRVRKLTSQTKRNELYNKYQFIISDLLKEKIKTIEHYMEIHEQLYL